MKITFLDRATFPESIEITRPHFEHQWSEYLHSQANEITERAIDCDVIVVNKVVLDAAVLSTLPVLKLIVVSATGYNNIDLDYCKAHGIRVCNVQGYAVNTVPEHTIAVLLALKRNLVAYHRAVENKRWHQSSHFSLHDYSVLDVHGSTLGLIGRGTIGDSVAQIAKVLGMNVVYLARHLDQVRQGELGLDDFLSCADVISIHAPLTPQTHNLIAADEFAKMSKKPILINTARGGIVDEVAAVNAIKTGQISGLAFDVLTQEPMNDAHPFNTILDRHDVLITPHNAWASHQAMSVLWQGVIDNMDGFVNGQPINVIV